MEVSPWTKAVWTFFSMPRMYFGSLTTSTDFSVLAWPGTIGLVLAAFAAIWWGRFGLLWFLPLFLLSQVLVSAAQLFNSEVYGYPLFALLGAFLLFQFGIAGYLIIHLKGSRIAAALLSLFTVSYALAVLIPAAFVFSDSYL
ncbi:hypothetical protein [Pelagibius marinus]|uniref:hypothetical protein n=1 Tax=Pelagibius marinus TaxID=2762760 RepID=UPI00187314EF|nr:hypothetical protein [Pelagibius marinus]